MVEVDPRTARLAVPPELGSLQERVSLLFFHAHGVDAVLLQRDEPLIVGRGAPSRVRLNHPSLSRQHARFELSGDEVRVEDLGSTNGVRVNGVLISEARLHADDQVTLGAVHVSVVGLGPSDAPLGGVLPHDRFRDELESEVLRHHAFRRRLGVMVVRARDGAQHLSSWIAQVQRRLRPMDRVGMYSPQMVELALPELADDELIALARDLTSGKSPALVCGVAQYPEAAATADELLELASAAARTATARKPVGVVATERARGPRGPSAAVVASSAMRKVMKMVDRLARAAIPVLIVGETGAGKEVVARALHEQSPRAEKPLRCINCAAIPDQLLESLLFGHEKGAFTDATQRTNGVFRETSGGTVFLDEIGELSAAAQAALLRVLETGKVTRVGGSQEDAVDVRLVAATHRDLEAMCEAGDFRWDLFFRINTMTLEVPPLRQRPEDIEPLAQRFLQEANQLEQMAIRGLSEPAWLALRAYHWPGNVRELRNVIQRAVVLASGDEISLADLTERIAGLVAEPAGASPASDAGLDFKTRVQRFEERLIRDALEACRWNRTEAATRLGMPRRTMTNKLRALGIAEPDAD